MSAIHRKRSAAIYAQLRLVADDQQVLRRAYAIADRLPHSDRRTRMLEDLGAVIDASQLDVDYLKSALSVVEGVLAQGVNKAPPAPNDPVASPKLLPDT